jgi:hypothetical protein
MIGNVVKCSIKRLSQLLRHAWESGGEAPFLDPVVMQKLDTGSAGLGWPWAVRSFLSMVGSESCACRPAFMEVVSSDFYFTVR